MLVRVWIASQTPRSAQKVSPGQSSSLWQVFGPAGAGKGAAAGAELVGVAAGAAGCASAMRNGDSNDCPASRVPAAGRSGRNGSSETRPDACALPARTDAMTQAIRTAAPATSRRIGLAKQSSLRREHLPLAVLLHEGDLAGLGLFALLALDLEH